MVQLVLAVVAGADPGDVGDAPPHQPFSKMLWINKVFQ